VWTCGSPDCVQSTAGEIEDHVRDRAHLLLLTNAPVEIRSQGSARVLRLRQFRQCLSAMERAWSRPPASEAIVTSSSNLTSRTLSVLSVLSQQASSPSPFTGSTDAALFLPVSNASRACATGPA